MISIEREKVYSASDVLEFGRQQLLPFTSRSTLQKLIRTKRLLPINSGTNKKPIYYFKGETLLAFLDAAKQLPIYQNND